MIYLGIDWGEKRIGLALADSETKIATPFKVAANVAEVLQVIEEEGIDLAVLGKPNSITNYQLRITNEEYNKFVEDLKAGIKIPLELADERLSSKAADALVGNKKTKAPRDAVAAMLILQSWLDKK
ncbi:MAG: Holliday junction resolvase RuvX [Patescibacteria group bacterium]|nr:Holliday junction resolvase RuvX [Patescibacteria group bacterium]